MIIKTNTNGITEMKLHGKNINMISILPSFSDLIYLEEEYYNVERLNNEPVVHLGELTIYFSSIKTAEDFIEKVDRIRKG
jgi:hypothetical protein